MTGRWLLYTDAAYVGGLEEFAPRSEATINNLVQDGGVVSIPGLGTGPVDTTTGAFVLEKGGPLFCTDLPDSTGQVAADGLSFDGTGTWAVTDGLGRCIGDDDLAVRGFRCGGGVVDTGSECLVDSCMECSGDPSVCVPLPDSTPCRSDDPCTAVATCHDGSCVASVSDRCPACTVCDAVLGCKPAPRENCRESMKPRSIRLALTNREGSARSSLRWRWNDGEATSALDLGHPDINSQVTLCVFSEATPDPQLLFQKSFGPFGPCLDPDSCTASDRKQGWQHRPDGSLTYREGPFDYSLIASSGEIAVGPDGEAGMQLKTQGPDAIPTLPAFAPPLRAQVQIDGGACFEATFDASGVAKNGDGVLRARGTP